MKNILYFIFPVFLLFCCSHTTKKGGNILVGSEDSFCYDFTTVYTIEGILSLEKFYGPPNYGETPEIDKEEMCYIITLRDPICILINDTLGENTYEENKYNQSRFQIFGYDIEQNEEYSDYTKRLKNLPIGSKISLTGVFDCAVTGHHHTDVLFILNKDCVPQSK
ncbi:MAG: DUF4431 domain-containing protein [Bacteroidales bacterium]|jgi:hypothetical protein|nr:DUF4431 domain-containing protein [Bacteroidales bacterium]